MIVTIQWAGEISCADENPKTAFLLNRAADEIAKAGGSRRLSGIKIRNCTPAN